MLHLHVNNDGRIDGWSILNGPVEAENLYPIENPGELPAPPEQLLAEGWLFNGETYEVSPPPPEPEPPAPSETVVLLAEKSSIDNALRIMFEREQYNAWLGEEPTGEETVTLPSADFNITSTPIEGRGKRAKNRPRPMTKQELIARKREIEARLNELEFGEA